MPWQRPAPRCQGIPLFGMVTGLIASWFVRVVEGSNADETAREPAALRALGRRTSGGSGESFTDERPRVG
ncbi:hypothetical protein JCM33774_47420 [Actinophytocola sp. KF-1]